MSYGIEILPAAAKELGGIPLRFRRQIDRKIRAMADNPHPAGAKMLKGEAQPICRVRSGDYRILYSVDDCRMVVTILKVGNRKDVYR